MRARWLWTAVACALVVICAAAGIILRQRRLRNTPPPLTRQSPRPGQISLPGKLQAQHVLPVGATLEGVIDQYLVEVGQEVVEGQLLARIKSETLEGARDAALLEAQQGQEKVSAMEAQSTSARLEASRAAAVAVSARALADR
ncbi:MAG: efflux RND transporter periplasmic adaptor subunit, partial [Acidobacteria bacterium]|nr:efflux RND transporter periplasmic adaptor subunit [Acidobacteriota bacterium]